MKLYFIGISFSFLVLFSLSANGQSDSIQIRKIYDESLLRGESYENLRYLCKEIGHRLSGSEGAQRAVRWGKELMERYGLDSVWLEPVMVPKWERGNKETCVIVGEKKSLDVLALGFSVGTKGKLRANVVEFKSLDDLKNAKTGSLTGKIAFLNQPMDARFIDTFNAYSVAAAGRVYGPSIAAERGAVGFVMRSVALRNEDFPHTGVMVNADGVDSIPSFALSTNAANYLSSSLIIEPKLELEMEANCKLHSEVESYNIVGAIFGSKYPEKVIAVGGHLDSWDVGEGAHDDGTGIVESIEVLRIFKKLGIKPNHTIRCVFFANEENGSRGGKGYAAYSKERGDIHLAAIESDRGGFTPRGFHIDGNEDVIKHFQSWLPLFAPYQIHIMEKGYGGVDINYLKDTGAPLIGVVPDSQRYFDIHHSPNDVFENVSKRELELNSAAMTTLIYLIDKYGIPGR